MFHDMEAAVTGLFDLTGKHALVTGGATGIGEGIARVLADAGATVIIADINIAGAGRVADDVGGSAVYLDVTDPEACESSISSVGNRLDILVNNAGSYSSGGSILDQDVEGWRHMVDVNLASAFNCAKPAAARMVDQGEGGAIVNVASVDGLLPCLGTGYDSAKAGVIHFSKSLAVDLAPHSIRVNCISPGHIDVPTLQKMKTGEVEHFWPKEPSLSGLMGPMMRQRSANIPLGRSGTPAEIGHTVLFLVSEASAYVTGQNIAVDGGWTLV